MGLESDMGRGTGRATGGGGGSKKEPGILLWPLPFGCRHTNRVRRTTCDNPQKNGMEKEMDAAQELQKNIHDGRRGWWKRGRKVGKNNQRNYVCRSFMEV